MVELAVTRAGDEGPVVTWLHGYTMDSRIWPEVWSRLPGFGHVGVDLPGHGRSPVLPASAPMDDWAQGVEDVMTASGSRLLVAVCMGTMVAADIVLRHRIPLDGVVLAAPALVGMDEDMATADRFRVVAVKAWRGASRAELAQVWIRPPTAMFAGMERFSERMAALRAIIADYTWPDLVGLGPSAFQGAPQTVARVAAAAPPLLLISGGQDMPAQRVTALALAEQVGSATLLDLPNLGHLPILEDPDAVTPAVGAFLARCAETSGIFASA